MKIGWNWNGPSSSLVSTAPVGADQERKMDKSEIDDQFEMED